MIASAVASTFPPRASRHVAVGALLALVAAAEPAAAGIVFREAEEVQAVSSGSASRQVRQVFADGEACKILYEEVSEDLVPEGAWVLASPLDAFLVDPAARTIAPVDATTMVPVAAGDALGGSLIEEVVVELLADDPGPAILGRPTRRMAWRIAYQEVTPRESEIAAVTRWEERHELWVTPWPEGEPPGAWHAYRIAEDGGVGSERRELREALGQVYAAGMPLRQVIERHAGAGDAAVPALVQRVQRELTSLARQDLDAATFDKPADYAPTEFLAPQSTP